MNYLSTAAFMFLCVFLFVLGAITHEADIQNSCAKDGIDIKSAWLGDLKCSPIKEEKKCQR